MINQRNVYRIGKTLRDFLVVLKKPENIEIYIYIYIYKNENKKLEYLTEKIK